MNGRNTFSKAPLLIKSPDTVTWQMGPQTHEKMKLQKQLTGLGASRLGFTGCVFGDELQAVSVTLPTPRPPGPPAPQKMQTELQQGVTGTEPHSWNKKIDRVKILATHRVGATCTAEHLGPARGAQRLQIHLCLKSGSGAPGIGSFGLVSQLTSGAGCKCVQFVENNWAVFLMIGVLSYMDITF